jgi:hypothetical protein
MGLVPGFDCSAQLICNWFKFFEQMQIRDLSFHQMSGTWSATHASVMLDQLALWIFQLLLNNHHCKESLLCESDTCHQMMQFCGKRCNMKFCPKSLSLELAGFWM